MQLIHNLSLVALCSLISAAVLALELAVVARVDRRKHGRAVARQM